MAKKKKTDAGDAQKAERSFAIVGVGASAGGLEAFTGLLKGLPLGTGMAFVLVQHLDPDHESALTQILSRATSLPVHEITDSQNVQPNHIYVIPRGAGLSIQKGVLKLSKRQPKGVHRPIDAFFESLASDQGERAIGVVLSGTATDGTLGLEAIKAEGGITFAQDGTAKHDSMPRSAIAAGVVDLVLPPEDIAKELARIARHPYAKIQQPDVEEDARAEATAHEDDKSPLPSGGHPSGDKPPISDAGKPDKEDHNGDVVGYKKIMLLLRNHSGVDFSLYKSTTIRRRIARRMILTKHETPAEYAGFLRGNGTELDSLYSDVLISVTSFFRNGEAFDSLQSEVLPELLAQKDDKPLRCWVLGCSTGQEAYSIAMAFMETAEKVSSARNLQIFATDLNDKLLEKARQGLYATNLAEDISPERLNRFFIEEKGGYRIKKSLREMVVFARQNLISDPPFSRMDLISCRNLLIYLEPTLQKKAMPTFHYALRPGGFLLLGASESVGGFTDLFEPVDRKQKIFKKKPVATHGLHLPMDGDRSRQREDSGREITAFQPPVERARDELGAQREADRITISQFAPPAVVIGENLEVVQFRGPTGAFLEPPVGKASFNVLKMAREGLMLPLRAAIEQAKKEGKPTRREDVRIKNNGASRVVTLEVIPLKADDESGFLIFFDDAEKPSRSRSSARPKTKPKLSKEEEASRIEELEAELAEMRTYFQAAQEESEAANEELQAGNEEIQSANEELQSVNEELETSKEELESANEELITVNEEMANRNSELNLLNNDLINFQNAVEEAVVVVDLDGAVRRFNAQAARQFGLLATDIGQPVGRIRHKLTVVPESGDSTAFDLEAASSQVIASGNPAEHTLCDETDGHWHQLRVRSYLTTEGKVNGAVLTFHDIDKLKRSEQMATHLAAIVEFSDDAIIGKDLNGMITSWNAGASRMYGYSEEETIGKSVTILIPEDHEDEEPRILARLRRGEVIDHYETVRKRKDGKLLDVSLTVSPVKDATGRIIGAAKIARDISAAKVAEASLQQSEDRYRTLFNSMDEGYCIIEVIFDKGGEPVDYLFVDVNAAFEKQAGMHEVVGKRMLEFVPSIESHWLENYGNVAMTGESVRFANEYKGLNRWFEVFAFRVGNPEERRIAVLFTDITERRHRDDTNLQKQKLESMGVLAGGIAHDFNNLLTGILGASSLVAEMPNLPESARPLMAGIETACLRAADLTRQILAYAGKGRFLVQATDISTEVEDVMKLITATMPKTVRLDLDLRDDLPVIMCDRGQLQQVIMNLVINAVESTPEGRSAVVNVSTSVVTTTKRQTEDDRNIVKAPPGDYVALTVKDEGGGLDRDTTSQVFDPFFSTKGPGRGLGLSAVQGIVGGHRGSLRIDSSPGKGSTFTVHFPVSESGLALIEGESAKSEPPDTQIDVGTVLVIDDEVVIRQVVRSALERVGVKVLTAANGLEGVLAFQKAPDQISKILLDLTMPVMDGQDALRRIRAVRQDVSVIAMSGYTEREALRHFGEGDEIAFLQKPFTISDLMKKLDLQVRKPKR